MRVGILSSCKEEIDDHYKELAKNIANYFAANDYDLVYGGGINSMMGICYSEFTRLNRNVYAYVYKDFVNDVNSISNAKIEICNTTFDLKKKLFENSDIIIVLPGGIGTYSEFLSFIEEKRCSNIDKLVEVYNENGYFNKLIEIINKMIDDKFLEKDIFDKFNISNNKQELIDHLNNYNLKEKR